MHRTIIILDLYLDSGTVDPGPDPDHHQNVTDWSSGHAPPFQKFNRNLFITFGDILLTTNDYKNTHTHAHTQTEDRHLHYTINHTESMADNYKIWLSWLICLVTDPTMKEHMYYFNAASYCCSLLNILMTSACSPRNWSTKRTLQVTVEPTNLQLHGYGSLHKHVHFPQNMKLTIFYKFWNAIFMVYTVSK